MVDRAAVKERLRRVPVVRDVLAARDQRRRAAAFAGSAAYWEQRYAAGGTSGAGSYGKFAEFKAEVLNEFVAREKVGSVIEFGCGDGSQLALADYPAYLGLDVSRTTIRQTMARYAGDDTKGFAWYTPALFTDPAGLLRADLVMSLDVIYHLVEDDLYHRHLTHVFGAARRFVVLYTSDTGTLAVDEPTASHVRHRPVRQDVAARLPGWRLREHIPNRYPYREAGGDGTPADFWIYEPVTGDPGPRHDL